MFGSTECIGPRRSRRWTGVAVAVALAGAGLALPAGPASARAGSALYLVTSTMPEYMNEATAILSCGPDTLYGVGASDDGNGYVVIDEMEPTANGLATVHAHEGAMPAPASWSLKAYAICGPTPTGGTTLVTQVSPSVGSSTGVESTSKRASCPSGLTALSGGYRVNTAAVDAGKVVVTDLIPDATSYLVNAFADGRSTVDPWTVQSTTLCATLSATAAPGQPTPVVSSRSTASPKTVDTKCTGGQSHIGVGFSLDTTDASVVPTKALPLSNLIDTVDLTRAEATVGPAGSTNAWSLVSYVRCATL